ncbi:TolC family outer membrane protein [Limnohabitans sp. WS1]|uniref:TolC family outer membrane protein n=1 Tax=Limnohabitans sp. WS1 TaxID=1100726 RepID=UPI000D37F71A|nr:TolC family outer membrane protein [Limnohabitans sp. WS1]PUE13308.1 channel protein TolC [Limnohabitans sp. WS1]
MRTTFQKTAWALALSAASLGAQAMGLLDAYKLALEQDATIRASRAALDAGRERLPQARAQLLPSVSANWARSSNRLTTTSNTVLGGESVSRDDYFSFNKTLSLRQPLFNMPKYIQYQQATDMVGEAEAVFERELQNLSVRVGGAYFEALMSSEQLKLVLSQKQQFTTVLAAAEKALALGTGTRTDMDDAKARLDMALAQELEARQNEDYTRRQLEILLNQPVPQLQSLHPTGLQALPALGLDLNAWLDKALAHSPEVKSLQARLQAADKEIQKAKAGHAPTLDAVAQWSDSGSENVTRLNSSFENKTLGFQLTIPLYQGGYVSSLERQAVAEKLRQEEALEAMRRDLGLRIHREYRGVTEGVLKIRALEQAVRSNEQLLDSTRKSVLAGVRTQLDVLNVEQQLATTHRDLIQARYLYLMSRLRLHALSGHDPLTALQDIHSAFTP